MTDLVMPASDARERFAELLDAVQTRRVLITKHSEPVAYLISVREFRSIEETIEMMSNNELLAGIAIGMNDLANQRTVDASVAFAQLDAELGGASQ